MSGVHSHTTFSALDGNGTPERVLEAVKHAGLPGFAVTDHGTTAGWYRADKVFGAAGVPLAKGVEAYFTPDRTVRDNDDKYSHLVLLAKDERGLQNIQRMQSIAWAEGFYYHPRVDYDVLRRHSEGVIATTACASGFVSKAIARGDKHSARDHIVKMGEIFGSDFYFELQPHPFDEQRALNDFLMGLSDSEGGSFRFVISNDSHYPFKEDRLAHDVSVCVATRSTLAKPKMVYDFEHHIKSFDELFEDFQKVGVPESVYTSAVQTTTRVLLTCGEVELPRGRDLMPIWPDADNALREQLDVGIREKIAAQGLDFSDYRDRLRYEYDLIVEKGFSDYFLVYQDMIRFSQENGIAVGPGRGSSGGSLVAFLLDITKVDPIFWNTSFERFLPKHRTDMPDIDTDFSEREPVVAYLNDKYGEDRVAHIANYQTLGPKQAITDVARVMEVMVPNWLKNEFDDSPGRTPPTIAEWLNKNTPPDDLKKVLETAATLEGNVRQSAITAAGVVLSREKISDYAAVHKKDGVSVICYDKVDAEEIGFVKMDILVIKAMTKVDHAMRLVEERGGELPKSIWNLPYSDKKMIREFARANTALIPQFQGGSQRPLMKKLKPEGVLDLVAANALSRPGADAETYIKRKDGLERTTYPHPSAEPFLNETYGLMIYQEQVMDVCRHVAGLDWPTVHRIRKMGSKKDASEAQELGQAFIAGAVSTSGMSESAAGALWGEISRHVGYSFNKSHAVAYFMIPWACMYLQVYHPFEWILANLIVEEDPALRSGIIREAARLKLDIGTVDINRSGLDWSYEGTTLIPGLTFVAGVGRKTAEEIAHESSVMPFVGGEEYQIQISKNRTEPRYALVRDLPEDDERRRFKVNKGVYNALLKAGAIPESAGDPIMSKVASGLPLNVLTDGEVKYTPHALWNAKPLSELAAKPTVVHAFVKNAKKGRGGRYELSLVGDVADVVECREKVEAGAYLLVIDGNRFKNVTAWIPLKDADEHPMDGAEKLHENLSTYNHATGKGLVYLYPGKKIKGKVVTTGLCPYPKQFWLDDEVEVEGLYDLRGGLYQQTPVFKPAEWTLEKLESGALVE